MNLKYKINLEEILPKLALKLFRKKIKQTSYTRKKHKQTDSQISTVLLQGQDVSKVWEDYQSNSEIV